MSALLEEILGSADTAPAESPSRSVSAVAWARVSTDMQEARGLSIPE
jgi:hypothetical protein